MLARRPARAHSLSGRLKYIRRIEDEYDLIIIDSTDPFGPGEGLFTMEFYGNCYKALKEHGVLVNQHESPFYKGDALACQRAHRNIVHSFELSVCFRRISRRIRPDTGCSAFRRAAYIRCAI